MFEFPISKRDFILSCLTALFVIAAIFISNIVDSSTKIVFCDVGQGDGSYIRVKNKIDILIDAGPDAKILSCLGKHMPFWDRKIELVVLSHPQKDHFGGLMEVLNRYQIGKIIMAPINSSNQSFKQLKQKIKSKKIPTVSPVEGTKIKILDAYLIFYWPTEKFMKTASINDNDLSYVFSFQRNSFGALFTGDAGTKVFDNLVWAHHDAPQPDINIIKIPHHGSKTGLNKNFLTLAKPTIAVISAGLNNSYGHPAKEVLDVLKKLKIKIRRTDKEGDIVFRLKE